jgi:hypothetical protein
MAATITNMIKNSGYQPAMGFPQVGQGEPNYGWLETISKGKAVAALGNQLRIISIDDLGNEIEAWSLINPWIKSVKYGELSYDNDDLTDVEVEIRYDWAEFKSLNAPFQADGKTELWTLDTASGTGRAPANEPNPQ